MRTVAPLQLTNLAKSFSLFFFVLTGLWLILNLLLFGGRILVGLVGGFFFLVNLALSAYLAWRYYKSRYHTIFSYDEKGFELQRGKEKLLAEWGDFSTVSLVHLGLGDFAVRLYKGQDDFLDIPASGLKLDPWGFRFEATELVTKP